jgi:hypothetical protein
MKKEGRTVNEELKEVKEKKTMRRREEGSKRETGRRRTKTAKRAGSGCFGGEGCKQEGEEAPISTKEQPHTARSEPRLTCLPLGAGRIGATASHKAVSPAFPKRSLGKGGPPP